MHLLELPANPAAANSTSTVAAAHGGHYNARFQTIANGLNAARVAAAASTLLAGASLSSEDRTAVTEVVKDLRNEAQALRNPKSLNYGDEGSFAFAGLALESLAQERPLDSPQDTESIEGVADTLTKVSDELEKMLTNEPPVPEILSVIARAFLDISLNVNRVLSGTGEIIDREDVGEWLPRAHAG